MEPVISAKKAKPAGKSAKKAKPAKKAAKKAKAAKKPAKKAAPAKKTAKKAKKAAKKPAGKTKPAKKAPAKKSGQKAAKAAKPKKSAPAKKATKKAEPATPSTASRRPAKKKARSTTILTPPRRPSASRSPELDGVSRQLAALALAHLKQDGHLSVRQKEQLRRAYAAAGESLGWMETALDGKSSNEAARKDLLKMAKRGVRSMELDLEAELAAKRKEVAQLEAVSAATRALAEDPNTTYETEITYEYTARDAAQSLVTKTHSVIVADADEAIGAADTIDRSLPSREKLSDQMIVALEEQRVELDVLKRTLPDFVKLSHSLLREVIANLQ